MGPSHHYGDCVVAALLAMTFLDPRLRGDDDYSDSSFTRRRASSYILTSTANELMPAALLLPSVLTEFDKDNNVMYYYISLPVRHQIAFFVPGGFFL